MVDSSRSSAVSPATNSPHFTCPSSIMLARKIIPSKKPRQALEISKTRHRSGNPNWLWTKEAVAGSIMSRDTDVNIRQSSSLGGIPEAAMAFFPARTAPSLGRVPLGQKRRSLIPLMSSRRPWGSLSLLYTGASLSSISSEVMTSGGSS